MKENNDFTVSKAEYKLIKRHLAALEFSQASSLYDVYRKPSDAKKQAYAQHEFIVDALIKNEWELPFYKCQKTRITSFNQFMFTCVTEIDFSYRPYSIYVISFPTATYIYYTTEEVLKIINTNELDVCIKRAKEIAKAHPNIN